MAVANLNDAEFEGEWLGFFPLSVIYHLTLDVKHFITECLIMKTERSGGPRSLPNSPTQSETSSAATLVSQKSDDTLAAPYPVSPQERTGYYRGLTTEGEHPDLLFRTNAEMDPWVPPTGRYAHLPTKHARSAHGTTLSSVWKDVGPEIQKLLHSTIKTSYSIDPVRFFTIPGDELKHGTLGPAVVWVTVHPSAHISIDTAYTISNEILFLLSKHHVYDAHIEWCEGVIVKAVGPPLLPIVHRFDPTAHVRRHLTAPLGIPIAPAEMEEEDWQGTLGFFFRENINNDGEPSDKVLAVTNHHVLCRDAVQLYDHRNTNSHQHVRVCGARRFQRGLNEIRDIVAAHGIEVGARVEEIAELERDNANSKALIMAQGNLEEHREAATELKTFVHDVQMNWGDAAFRNIGVLEYSPPISVDIEHEGYMIDWATIKLDKAKFENFVGNKVDLGKL